MRLVLVVTIAWSAVAHADDAADAVARGEAFGRQGAWTQAIEQFKAADHIAARAKHACLIGLAYTRRELWAEAELYFAICHQRATPSDPTPDWLAEAETQLADKLTASNAAAITLRVEPADADITVSSFAPDETFRSRTIHLAAGAHVVTVTAPGYVTKKQEVVVSTNAAREVVIRLERIAPHSRVPYYLLGGAAAIGIAALAYDLTAVSSARAALETKYQYDYDANLSRYQSRRNIAIALTGAAIVTATAGVVLEVLLDKPPPVTIGAEVGGGGAAVLIGWSR